MWKALDQIEARLAFVACIITPGFCILGTALRFLDAIKSRRRINCEDWCALGALLSFLAYTTMTLWSKATQIHILFGFLEYVTNIYSCEGMEFRVLVLTVVHFV